MFARRVFLGLTPGLVNEFKSAPDAEAAPHAVQTIGFPGMGLCDPVVSEGL